MVQNNKVLTVSYGTFSCTLEGFEDSFGTMKVIAEYFRDLASDDRYFGAEPPQPDADMLARIAQREVARQVEARTSSEGIHLRAAAAAAPALAQDIPKGSVPETTVPETTVAKPPVMEAPLPEVAVSETSTARAVKETEGNRTAAESTSDQATNLSPDLGPDLSTVSSTVDIFEDDKPQSAAVTPDSAAGTKQDLVDVAPAKADEGAEEIAALVDADIDVINEDIADTAEEDPARTADQASTQASTVDMETIAAISAAVAQKAAAQTDSPEDSAVELFTPTDSATTSRTAPQTEDNAADTVPAADSIAAKLQRIRAVVAQTPQDEFSEDEHAEAFVEAAAAELSQDDDEDEPYESSFADDDEISRALDLLDLNAELSSDTDEDDLDESPLGDDNILFGDPAPVEDRAETGLGDVALSGAGLNETGAPKADQEQPKRIARIARLKKATTLETPESPAGADLAAQDDATPDAETPADSTSAAEGPVEDEAPADLPRARIVKMKRSDLEKAIAAGGLQEITEADETAFEGDAEGQPETVQPETAQIQSTLDEAAEADLLRELAEVEADLLASAQDDTPVPTETPPVSTLSVSKDSVSADNRPATPSPDSDMSRLLAAAESKLGDPDNATSRETYSHLRAAVAAAEADRTTGGGTASGDESEPYREDLANVVRPRRPESGSATPSRPRVKGARPAPLKLVAEQRIDSVATTSAKPVRPRRISVLEEEATSKPKDITGTFADYAQERGAVELHELLEAAAAYMSFVEGRDHFSRPQLMNKVRSMGNGDFNREDGLRSFGQLLRDGKIERAENGRFAATEEIGFRPAKRAAG